MDHQHDTADTATGDRRCDSTFDRWGCGLPAGHDGPHVSRDDVERVEWNDRAAGRRLRHLTGTGRGTLAGKRSAPVPEEPDQARGDDDGCSPSSSGAGSPRTARASASPRSGPMVSPAAP